MLLVIYATAHKLIDYILGMTVFVHPKAIKRNQFHQLFITIDVPVCMYACMNSVIFTFDDFSMLVLNVGVGFGSINSWRQLIVISHSL